MDVWPTARRTGLLACGLVPALAGANHLTFDRPGKARRRSLPLDWAITIFQRPLFRAGIQSQIA